MKQFLFGFVAALLLIAAAGLGYVALGLAPVATASAPLALRKADYRYRIECACQQRSAEIITHSAVG